MANAKQFARQQFNEYMKVLMFGWEFPPHISGGLGTACFGITKGLSTMEDIEISFVVPRMYGDEQQNGLKLLTAEGIALKQQKKLLEKIRKTMDYIEVESKLVPYCDPDEYQKQTSIAGDVHHTGFKTDPSGRFRFSGQYGADLFTEVSKYALAADSLARDLEFDIIHAHDWLTYPAGIAAKRVSGKPLVLHVHATDFDRSGGKANPGVFRIEKAGLEAADKIITVSNLTRDIVINRYGIRPEKTVTVYNAVQPLKERAAFTFKKGFDEKIVTFLGRITMQKGPGYFVEAADTVLQKMHNVRFAMAGSGDMMEKTVSRVAELGIGDRFHFTGFLKGDEVFELLHLSDAYVMPSVSEPFGISPLEAMQSRVPVIISKQSGVSEILKHALKVDFWDVEALADAIHAVLSYPVLSRMLVKQGKSEADSLKWEDAARHIHSVYKSLLAA